MEPPITARALDALGSNAAPVRAIESAMRDLVLQPGGTADVVARDARVRASTGEVATWIDGVQARYGDVVGEWSNVRLGRLATQVRNLPDDFPHNYPWSIRDPALRAYDSVRDLAIGVQAVDSLGGPAVVAAAGSVEQLAGVQDALRGVALQLAREDAIELSASMPDVQRLALRARST